MISIENRLRGLFETMTEGVVLHEIVCDETGTAVDYVVHDVNPAFTRQVGISREMAVGALASELYGSGEAPHLEIYAEVAATGRPTRFQTHFPSMDQHFDISVFSPRRGWFATIFLDITPLKRMQAQLTQERDRLAAIMRSSPVGIVQVDADHHVHFANDRAVELIGLELVPEDDRLQLPDEIELCDEHGAALPIQQRPYRRVLVTGEPIDGEHVTVVHSDGRRYHLSVSGVPLHDEDGQVYAMVGTVEDVTARVEAEQQEQLLQDQLERMRKLESIGRLAGGIAHDFNNLLTPILGYAEMAMMHTEEGSALARHLAKVTHSAERARELISQFLAFGRKQVLEVQVCSLNTVVADYESVLRRLVREDIRLQLELLPQLGNARVDPGQLQQILLNLASNAMDAMPGSGRLTIETRNTTLDESCSVQHPEVTPGPYVMLAVSDTGEGMDTATRERIFEPFFTTKEAGKGTGLGLATVYGLVMQHGGHIWVYSEQGVGTTFKIYLPRVDEGEQQSVLATRHSSSREGHEVVLLVEDDHDVRELARTILEQRGYSVIEANDSDSALAEAAAIDAPIDLLFTDVIVPRMNGREIYRRVRRIHSDIRVLYMSGYTDNVIGDHGMLEEGIHFLQKPFSAQDLLAKVEDALAG